MNQFPPTSLTYRGALVYRQEDGYTWITITLSVVPGETSQVTTHAHNLPLVEEAEPLPGVDLYHFAVSEGTQIQLAIVSETETTKAWYTVARNTVIARFSHVYLSIIRSSESMTMSNHF